MSADLLAEFDPYYKAPQGEEARTPTVAQAPNIESASQSFNLDFFESKATQPSAPATLHTADPSPLQNGQLTERSDTLGTGRADQQEPQGLDDWGDFESATLDIAPSNANDAQTPHGRSDSIRAGSNDNTTSPWLRADTSDFFSSTSPAQPSVGPPKHSVQKASVAASASDSSNIIFDADNLSEGHENEIADEDEFGDFETISNDLPALQQLSSNLPSTTAAPQPLINPYPNPHISPQAPKAPSQQERGYSAKSYTDSSATGNKKASPHTSRPTHEVLRQPTPSQSPSGAKPQQLNRGRLAKHTSSVKSVKETAPAGDDSWDWDALDVAPSPAAPVSEKQDTWAWEEIEAPHEEEAAASTDNAPPTNVPPPSVLLTVFPQLFDLLRTTLLQPVADKSLSLKSRIASDPSTIEFLRAYISTATVAARVVAGRKSRWKRDKHLSQAMSIGPSVAGGKSGMKLTGVDKSEASREQREAAELVRAWREQIGRLRSAVAIANSSLPAHSALLVVPEINESMVVRTATMADGALTAPKCCFLCGLKRDERIAKVDVHVEDSFGEWWVDHWGHRACKDFWIKHQSKLKQR